MIARDLAFLGWQVSIKALRLVGARALALRLCDRAVIRFPEHAALFTLEMADTQAKAGDVEAATAAYSLASERGGGEMIYPFAFAEFLEARGEKAKAIEWYKKAASLSEGCSEEFKKQLSNRIDSLAALSRPSPNS